jgi:hypothetical protein
MVDGIRDFAQSTGRLRILKPSSQSWSALLAAACLLLAGCGRESEKDPEQDGAAPSGGPGGSPSVPTVQTEAERRAESEQLDPRSGPWQSEVFAEQAGGQLEQLAAMLKAGDGFDARLLSEIAEDEIAVTALRPDKLETVFEEQGITVRRAMTRPRDEAKTITLTECATVFRDLIKPLGGPSARRVALKIGRIDLLEDGGAETSVSYDAAGEGIQQRAEWLCRWEGGSENPPRLVSVSVTKYEEVESAEGKRWFQDLTASVFGDDSAFRNHLAFGLHHWLGRIDRAYGINYFRRNGIAVGDANGDGLDDLYVCQPGGLPNRLFLHQPDGRAKEVATSWGVDWLDHCASALFLDLDNDGDQDLVLAAGSRVQILENVQNKSFRSRAQLPILDQDSLSLSSADYDGDGDLDLFLCVGFADKNAHAKQGRILPGFVFHNSRDGGRNVLFRNDGNWVFGDATRVAGLEAGNHRHSLAASWEDFDRDGDPDLYLANDYGPNSLYRNESGRFEEVAAACGVLDYAAGMSVSWGDYDRDGWMDLHVANMFSYAGRRISTQPGFLPASDAGFRAVNRRFSKGNSLFKNSPDGTFTETSVEAGVERGRWAWGSLFADLNNDGWEDLFVANGYITTPDPGDL